jgi:hypothetical protein
VQAAHIAGTTTLKIDETARIDPARGSLVFWVYQDDDTVSNRRIFFVGTDNVAGRDAMLIRTRGTTPSNTVVLYWRSGTATASSIETAIGSFSKNTWHHLYCEWDGTTMAIEVDGVRTSGTRITPQGNLSTTQDMAFGSNNAGGGGPIGTSQLGGSMYGATIFNRPLTTTERENLRTRMSPWRFDMLVTADGLINGSSFASATRMRCENPLSGPVSIASQLAASQMSKENPLSGNVIGMMHAGALGLTGRPLVPVVFTGAASTSRGFVGTSHVARLDNLTRHGAPVDRLASGDSITVDIFSDSGDAIASGSAINDGANDWVFPFAIPDAPNAANGLQVGWTIRRAGDEGRFLGRVTVDRFIR